ncbi:MAG TPA: hypothetical protein DEP35_13470 [Deltaproteobacteria bacterium]|nr:hypothetical protein [Deltaproteobacteria bacterium]
MRDGVPDSECRERRHAVGAVEHNRATVRQGRDDRWVPQHTVASERVAQPVHARGIGFLVQQ